MAGRADAVQSGVRIRALAHPLRLRLLTALQGSTEGLRAVDLAESLGIEPSGASYHLRILAKYGFVREVEGVSGRSRPWVATSPSLFIDNSKLTGDARVAYEEFLAQWRALHDEDEQQGSAGEGFEFEWVGALTDSEMAKLAATLTRAVSRYNRSQSEIPDGAKRRHVRIRAFPQD
jgi:DNA-binding transcriptional ArsR family regulator